MYGAFMNPGVGEKVSSPFSHWLLFHDDNDSHCVGGISLWYEPCDEDN